MGYDNNGGSSGCCGFPFGGFMNGFGGFGFDALLLLVFFGLMGGGMWGGWGGMGGWGGGWGGAGMLGTTSLAATETASLINQQNTADRVAAMNAKADAIAGIVTANGSKIETVKDAVTNGFFANQTSLCELGNNIAQQFNAAAMQGVNNYNGLTNQITDVRFGIQSSFCDLRHQMQVDKCDTLQAIAASKAEILGYMNAQRMAELEAKNAKLENELSQSRQNATLIAALGPQRGCGSTCGSCCNPSPCDQLSAAIIQKGIDGIVNPTTAAAA